MLPLTEWLNIVLEFHDVGSGEQYLIKRVENVRG